MAQVLFNQLTYIDRLLRGGFSADQARASAEALDGAFAESVATRRDLAETEGVLKQDIAAVTAELKQDISAVRTEVASVKAELKQDIAAVRTEVASVKAELKLDIAAVRTEVASVKSEIAQSKVETLRWMITFILGLVGAIFAIVKFVH